MMKQRNKKWKSSSPPLDRLILQFGKFRNLSEAKRIFAEIPVKFMTSHTINAIIGACVLNGNIDEAVSYYLTDSYRHLTNPTQVEFILKNLLQNSKFNDAVIFLDGLRARKYEVSPSSIEVILST